MESIQGTSKSVLDAFNTLNDMDIGHVLSTCHFMFNEGDLLGVEDLSSIPQLENSNNILLNEEDISSLIQLENSVGDFLLNDEDKITLQQLENSAIPDKTQKQTVLKMRTFLASKNLCIKFEHVPNDTYSDFFKIILQFFK